MSMNAALNYLGTHTHVCTYNTHVQFYPDRAVQRDVMDVLVKCTYHTMGCPWTGQLKNWEVRKAWWGQRIL